jgi:hypothetical protein
MKLTDLEPRWLTPNVFVFKCPHCVLQGWEKRQHWLSCKNVAMSNEDQWNLFQTELGDRVVVPSKADMAWNFSTADFSTISITPSIDASPSGDWHGHVTAGEIA